MLHGEALGLVVGAVTLGAVHGIEPGHGWPVAASYALDRSNKWAYGFAASFILGVGHLISSIAMVLAFFYAKAYFNLTEANEPITVLDGVQIGGPVSLVAGILLIALGIREYLHGHSHGGRHDDHEHDSDRPRSPEQGSPLEGNHHGHDHDHHHAHDHGPHPHHSHVDERSSDNGGLIFRLKEFLPFVGGHAHHHDDPEEATDRGLLGIAWFAFVLGFAHEEEFEIIALCAGSDYCLELMSIYAVSVIVGIVGLTMLLIAGYQHYEEKVERYTPYLPLVSAAVLIFMGVGFVVGVF